jgi:hypothetical protein
MVRQAHHERIIKLNLRGSGSAHPRIKYGAGSELVEGLCKMKIKTARVENKHEPFY